MLAFDNRLSSLGVEAEEYEADDNGADAPTVPAELKTNLEGAASPMRLLALISTYLLLANSFIVGSSRHEPMLGETV